jgi:hypothetical protein
VTIKGDADQDYHVAKNSATEYEITQLPDGKPTKVKVSDIDLEYGALLRFK